MYNHSKVLLILKYFNRNILKLFVNIFLPYKQYIFYQFEYPINYFIYAIMYFVRKNTLYNIIIINYPVSINRITGVKDFIPYKVSKGKYIAYL